MKNYSNKILVTGGNGQIASALRHHPSAKDFALIFRTREELDITDLHSIQQNILDFSPTIIINTAAYTAVDKAEQEKESALKINFDGAKNLAQICHEKNILLIHLSTDYVFSGEKNIPYLEEDIANPINYYGESKWLGEEAIRQHCEKHIILRVSGVFSEYGNNFFKTILHLAQTKNDISVVTDQMTCPTHANDIATTILTIAQHPIALGTYHYCSGNPTSWFEFATQIIAEIREKHIPIRLEKINRILSKDYPTLAKRPLYSILDCQKIKSDYGIIQSSGEKALDQVLKKLLKDK